MKRLTALSAVMLALSIAINFAGLTMRVAQAVVPSKPYTFIAGTQAQSAQVNADFDTLYSVLNGNLDHTNLNSSGIYASDIKPTSSAGATFGGTLGYTFANGLTVNNGLVLGAPLPIAQGGTGATSAALGASAPLAVSGTFPNQTVALTGVVPVANGGNGSASPGIGASAPLAVSGAWPTQTLTCSTCAQTGTSPSFTNANFSALAPSSTLCTDASKNLSTSGCGSSTVYTYNGGLTTGLYHLHGSATCTIQSSPYNYACDALYNISGISGLASSPQGGCSAGRSDTSISYPHLEVIAAVIVDAAGYAQLELNDYLGDKTAIGTAGSTIPMYYDCWIK